MNALLEGLHAVVLYDVIADDERAAPDLTIGATIAAVERALSRAGCRVTRVAFRPAGLWLPDLADADVVFNLCEGMYGDATFEPRAIATLEALRLPHTGASSWTTALCLRKPAANALLAAEGLPVPPFAVVRSTADVAVAGRAAGFPCIVKPAAEDASLGVTQASVARDAAALAARCAEMLGRWPELVVQRFVAGREISVGLLAGEVLPPSEIDFSAMPAGLWPIVTYESKWVEGSAEDLGSRPRCPADLDASLGAELGRLAVAAWRAVGGTRGAYGRVDFRVDGDGRPWVLEVNANPDLAPDAGFARMAAAAGIGDHDALVTLLTAAALGGAGTADTDGADAALLASGVH